MSEKENGNSVNAENNIVEKVEEKAPENVTAEAETSNVKKPKKEKPPKKNKGKEVDASSGEDKDEPLDKPDGRDKPASDSSKYKYVIQNKKIRRYSKNRIIVIIVSIFLMLTILGGGAVYAIMLAVDANNYKVLVDKEGEEILSLSIDDSFSSPTEVLAIAGPQYMDNISLEDFRDKLPEIKEAHGSASGEKYIAATFYLSNISQKPQKYREMIRLADVTKNVDEAIRVMVIKGDSIEVYAKAQADGAPEEVVPGRNFAKANLTDHAPSKDPAWLSTPFLNENYVFNNSDLPIAVGETIKYSIVIWLEGWDEQCKNPILGGTIKVDFEFSRV